MAKRPQRRKSEDLPGLEGSTVPGRITLNFSGEMAKTINAMAAKQAVSKNSVAESLIRKSILDGGVNRVAARTSRQAILRYTRVLIEALEDAENYEPGRHNNRAAPELRVSDDERFLDELRELTAELKRLNDILERKSKRVSAVRPEVTSLGRHFDKFLTNYAAAFGRSAGRGSWYLLIGSIAGLLHHAGVDKGLIESIWRHLRGI
ncbi:hypothetical protein [Bradyrhizobium tunisiense]|uniref:hypothetical protein n=1 Tax=Bradyrhizobium tunisiense TaxID=3278709 RepID=UPI0035D7874B